jgi:hypothetical protein
MSANNGGASAIGPLGFYRIVPLYVPYLLITCGPGRLWIAHVPPFLAVAARCRAAV